jgi:hypothetical protein
VAVVLKRGTLAAAAGLGQTAAPATGMSTGAKVAIGVGAVLGAIVVIGTIGVLTRRPGWYVVNYNYPVGHPDRRVKGYAGPYPTREDAVAKARTLTSVWYPKVAQLDGPPY